MRRPALALAALLLALPGAHAALADDVTFAESSYLRAAVGDVPRTPAEEPARSLNAVLYQRFAHTAGEPSVRYARVPPGGGVPTADCTCGAVTVDPDDRQAFAAVAGTGYRVEVPADAPAGPHVLAFRYALAAADAFALSAALQDAEPQSASAVFYVPEGWVVESDAPVAVAGLPSTPENPGLRIYRFDGTPASPLAAGTWFTLHPESVPADAPAAGGDGFPWVPLALGAAAGALLWALLVQRGLVQRKGRKQVARAAAHAELAAQEPKELLEGRKRALLAALKELEAARQAAELDAAAYDALKADFKRQAVAVLRALEGDGKA